MRGQNRHLMTACQPVPCASIVSAGVLDRGCLRSGADGPAQNLHYCIREASVQLAFLYPAFTRQHFSPAPIGNQREA